MNKKIACVGILVADAIAKPITKIPEKGKLELCDNITLSLGGCASICAMNLAKLGIDVTIIGKVGNDSLGDFMRTQLNKNGVKTSGIVSSIVQNTSASCVLVSEDGERSFIHSIGANGDFIFEDVRLDIIQNSDIVFIGGTMLMTKFDGADCSKVLKKSKEFGKYTVLDTAWDSQGRWMNVLAPCMPYIDLFMPSIDEAVQLAGGITDPSKIADLFMSMGCGNVVIKLGSDGCFMKTADKHERVIPAFKVNAIDTTGAGDSFVSGFLTGLAKSYSFDDCARFANAVGANCVMDFGTNGIKSFEQINKFLNEHM